MRGHFYVIFFTTLPSTSPNTLVKESSIDNIPEEFQAPDLSSTDLNIIFFLGGYIINTLAKRGPRSSCTKCLEAVMAHDTTANKNKEKTPVVIFPKRSVLSPQLTKHYLFLKKKEFKEGALKTCSSTVFEIIKECEKVYTEHKSYILSKRNENVQLLLTNKTLP